MEPDEDQHYFVRLTFLLRWNLGLRGKLLSLASNRASGLILTFRGILDFFRENFVLIFSRASNLREVTTRCLR